MRGKVVRLIGFISKVEKTLLQVIEYDVTVGNVINYTPSRITIGRTQ